MVTCHVSPFHEISWFLGNELTILDISYIGCSKKFTIWRERIGFYYYCLTDVVPRGRYSIHLSWNLFLWIETQDACPMCLEDPDWKSTQRRTQHLPKAGGDYGFWLVSTYVLTYSIRTVHDTCRRSCHKNGWLYLRTLFLVQSCVLCHLRRIITTHWNIGAIRVYLFYITIS